MSINIVEEKFGNLVGISWSGAYSDMNAIPTLFTAFEDRIEQIKHKDTVDLIICPFHDRKTDFTYYVMHKVTEIEDIPQDMVHLQLPKQKYAKTIHNGLAMDIEKTYNHVFEWMKQHGYNKDYQSLSIEVYHKEDKEINSSKQYKKFDIYVPIM